MGKTVPMDPWCPPIGAQSNPSREVAMSATRTIFMPLFSTAEGPAPVQSAIGMPKSGPRRSVWPLACSPSKAKSVGAIVKL